MTDTSQFAKASSSSAAHAAPRLLELDGESRSRGHTELRSAVDETSYTWDLVSDQIAWDGNAADILRVRTATDIGTGTAFQTLVAPEHATLRHAAIAGARAREAGKSTPYRVRYRLSPAGRRNDVPIWIEDHGRWWAGAGGVPVTARGILRIIDERYWDEQRHLLRGDYDELTGQLNRNRLTEELDMVMEHIERAERPCAFLMVSVNNLAVINDTFGFHIGDEMIAATARIIKEQLRRGDQIGRYSANKFGVILNDCNPDAMRSAAERIITAVRKSNVKTTACLLSASVSIGSVVLPEQARTTAQALSCALLAVERAKLKRYDCFVEFEPSPERETTRRHSIDMANEVVSALEANRMFLMLQPIVSSKTEAVAMYECLLRMQRPDGTVVSAGEFIPVAEQLGLARLIDQRALELAVGLIKNDPALKISLNISSLTASGQEWLTALRQLTEARTDLTRRMTIEITETAAIGDLDQSIAFVKTLKALGCGVAIDDFGSGYTSFRNLKLLAVDIVKIDGDFVKNLSFDSADLVFVRAMADLAHSLGMETVAEWVVDAATAEIVRKAGITYLQGYHYGLPVRPECLPKPAAA